jgi:plastocyanin
MVRTLHPAGIALGWPRERHGDPTIRCSAGVAWLLLFFAAPGSAAQLVVHLDDGHGHAAADAVVWLTSPAPSDAATTSMPPVTRVIDQRMETFVPYVQLLHPGDKVVFRNSDSTRHHVYSFASIRTFEFVLRPGESSPALEMDKPGIAAVGCNIHDHMITYLFVSTTAAISISGVDGTVTLDHLAPGPYTVHVWHPQLHPGRPEPSRHVDVDGPAATQATISLSLLPDPRMFMNREHLDY